MIKACWWCKQFSYEQAIGGYSEYTPGSDFDMSCNKSVWDFCAFSSTQEEFGKCLAAANECEHFECIEVR